MKYFNYFIKLILLRFMMNNTKTNFINFAKSLFINITEASFKSIKSAYADYFNKIVKKYKIYKLSLELKIIKNVFLRILKEDFICFRLIKFDLVNFYNFSN